jgi:heme iron utilization protein
MQRTDPVLPADEAARAMASALLSTAGFAALAVLDPVTGTPAISRIAFARDPSGTPMSLISSLSAHHAALLANPAAAILVGEPGPKGDPLTHPRLMLQGIASFVPRTDSAHVGLRDHWLAQHPKSKLYIDFADFGFVRFAVISAMLNGGFGKAFRLAPDDLV